ncbi:MAG: hypothetical protein OR994_03445, partial [Candidatus Poseidoniales archaeon]|nr:hypothetical protein [Candidatus Poseidoniales archaeon]
EKLENCEWYDEEINEKIREATAEIEISRREGYVALYMLILGIEFGPRIASIIAELGKDVTMQIFSKSL